MVTTVLAATVPVNCIPGAGNVMTVVAPVVLSVREAPVSDASRRSGAVPGALPEPINVAAKGEVIKLPATSTIVVAAVTVKDVVEPYAPGNRVIHTFVASAWRTAAVTPLPPVTE